MLLTHECRWEGERGEKDGMCGRVHDELRNRGARWEKETDVREGVRQKKSVKTLWAQDGG